MRVDEFLQHDALGAGLDGLQIRGFGFSDELDPFRLEVAVEARQRESRAVDLRRFDHNPVKVFGAHQDLEVEFVHDF